MLNAHHYCFQLLMQKEQQKQLSEQLGQAKVFIVYRFSAAWIRNIYETYRNQIAYFLANVREAAGACHRQGDGIKDLYTRREDL